MTSISIDFETYSECDIKTAGSYNYAAHPTTEVLCMAWAIDDEEPQLWTPDDVFPQRLVDVIIDGAEVWAWNAAFERAVWEHWGTRNGMTYIQPHQWNDTAALAATLALPRALGQCAQVLDLSEQKDTRGRYLIQRLCQPFRGERRRDQHLLDELYDYCKQDVLTERAVKQYLLPYKPMSLTERDVWLLDQAINWRGLKIDTYNVNHAIGLIYQTAEKLNERVREISGGILPDCGSRQRVMAWSRDRGYKLEGYDKAAVLEALADPALPDDVRAVLEIRQTLGKASTSKYTAMQNLAATHDERARGVFWYHGAQTGRWAGRGFQPQNLPRPAFKDTDNCIRLFEHNDVDIIEALYGDPMVALSSCLRGMIVADEGNRLLVSDFSAIEARVLAWLADEQGPLDVFREGGDIYIHAAMSIYNCLYDDVTPEMRQIGKVAVLALGYQGGVGAFQTMAKAYRVVVEDEAADAIKVKWRKAHKKIVRFWYDLEAAAINAVKYRGHAFEAGPITFKCHGDFLFAKLPSGRRLAYFRPTLANEKLTFWGTDSKLGGRWAKLSTYGGKLAENVTQAVARDLLSEAMLRLDALGYWVVATIHDEIICEVRKGDGSLAEMEEVMCQLPDWATGLPMDAEGFECERYRK